MGSVQQIVPDVPKNVEAQIVEMKVPLYSYGCEKKVKKALSQIRGIHSVHVNYDLQKVTVWGICDRDVVLATIKKKRRESRFWNPGNLELYQGNIIKEEKDTEICMEEEIAENNQVDEIEEEVPQQPGRNETSSHRRGGVKGRKLWKKLFPLVL